MNPTGSDANAAAAPAALRVRPTIFVALGGTGKEVILRLRRRILQADWNGHRLNSVAEFPAAAFLYFDTDSAAAKESDRSQGTDPLAAKIALSEGEVLQKKVNIEFYQAERTNFPAIDDWLPKDDLSRINASKGAGQIRCISRLLFFDEYKNFSRILENKGAAVLSNVSNEAALRALGLSTGAELRVVVIGSAAGGTGSGAFIDAGYAISSLETPRPSAVDLFLILPTGYAGANKERVFANGFASLSELEYVMRGSPTPPYVTRWGDYDAPVTASRPFTDVFLFDTHNLSDEKTGRVDDLYDMIADVLFEDFANAEFATTKRSIFVNAEQHKMYPWVPTLSSGVGRGGESYSRSFSALGQATVATRGHLEFSAVATRAAITMIEAFFGLVRSADARNLPTPDERNAFLADKLDLRATAFAEFPDVIRGKARAIEEYDLVETLGRRPDNSSVADGVAVEIEEAVASIRLGDTPIRDWRASLDGLVARIKDDILGRVGSGEVYGPRGREVAEARARFEAALLAPAGPRSVKAALYRLVDDQERGGIVYTTALVEQVQERIWTEGGAAALLEAAAENYAATADDLLTVHGAASLERLSQIQPKLWNSGRKDAEGYSDQIRADLVGFARLRLRSIAAKEAAAMLRRVAAALGRRVGVDEARGLPRFDGLLGELHAGRADLDRTLGELRHELAEIDDAVRRGSGGTFIALPSGVLPEIKLERPVLLGWALETFKAYGGAQALFPMLREDEARGRLLNAVRETAKRQLSAYEARIPTAVDALREMPPADQRRDLSKMVSRSLPWIFANFDRFKPGADQYKMIIAVHGARAFEAEFGPILKTVLPNLFGSGAISYSESAVRGRIVCYCELSGYPLNVLAPLRRDWRACYDQMLTEGAPLHNHGDYLRFPDPLAPSTEEVRALTDTFDVFLRAICLGLLGRDKASRVYHFERERGFHQKVGSERTIRRKMLEPVHRSAIEAKLNEMEAELGPLQVLAAAALFDWTARRAYAPRRVTVNYDAEDRIGGIAHATARNLARRWRERAAAMPRALPAEEADAAYARLFETVEEWTVPLAGSLGDVDATEANKAPNDDPRLRAVDKRAVDPRAFTEEALARIVSGIPAPGVAAFAGGFRPPPPPPPPSAGFYLFRNGQVEGPYGLDVLAELARQGAVGPATQLCPEGGAWAAAGMFPELAAILPGRTGAPAPPARVLLS